MVKKVFLILFGMAVCLVFVEVILRLSGFGYKLIYTLPAKSKSDYTIFCVGESTTVGVGARNMAKENYPRQLEEMLNSQFPNKPMQCFFDVTIGANTSEILMKFQRYIQAYRPHLIILMVGANNWWNLDKSNILLFNKNRYIPDVTLKALIFLDKFRLYKLIKWVRLSLGLYKERWDCYGGWNNEAEEINRIYGREIWEVFDALAEHDISEMVKICKANGIKVIICSYPMTGGNQYFIQKRIATKFKVLFVDNYALFKNLPNLNDYISEDGWHPNEKGYTLVAENIYNCIMENRLIE